MHSAISRLYFHTLSDFAYPAFYSPHSKVVVLYIGPSPTLSWINSPFRSFSRYLKKRNKKRARNGGLEHSLALNRTNYPPSLPAAPSILFLTAFLSLIRYSILLNEAFVPSFLPAFLAYPLAAFRFAVDYTREDMSPPPLPVGIYLSTLSSSISPLSSLLPVPSARNACPSFLTMCLSSATSFYSASRIFKRYYSSFRETPSRILDLRRRVFPVRRAPGYHSSFSPAFRLSWCYVGVTR